MQIEIVMVCNFKKIKIILISKLVKINKILKKYLKLDMI